MKMVDLERKFVITSENEMNITTPNFNAKFLGPRWSVSDVSIPTISRETWRD